MNKLKYIFLTSALLTSCASQQPGGLYCGGLDFNMGTLQITFDIVSRNEIDGTVTICGFVKDSTEAVPIHGAFVAVKNKLSVAETDSVGKFCIKRVINSDTLQFSSFGYHTKEYLVHTIMGM